MNLIALKKRLNAKCKHFTPASWGGQHRTHSLNHITGAGIRQPWTAVSALFGLMIDSDGHSTGLVCVSTLLVAFLFFLDIITGISGHTSVLITMCT